MLGVKINIEWMCNMNSVAYGDEKQIIIYYYKQFTLTPRSILVYCFGFPARIQ